MGKKKVVKVEPTYLYLIYNTTSTGGEVCKGQEDESWPSYEDTHITHNFISLHKTEQGTKRFFYNRIEVSPELLNEKQLYLAVIYYIDGNTFGTTYGNAHFVGCFKTPDEAEKAIDYQLSQEYSGYKPWDGYFAGKDGSDLVLLSILD